MNSQSICILLLVIDCTFAIPCVKEEPFINSTTTTTTANPKLEEAPKVRQDAAEVLKDNNTLAAHSPNATTPTKPEAASKVHRESTHLVEDPKKGNVTLSGDSHNANSTTTTTTAKPNKSRRAGLEGCERVLDGRCVD